MSSSAYAIQDIEGVLIKLWQNRNVMLMNKSSTQDFGLTDSTPRKAEALLFQGEVGKDLVKLPVYEIEKQVLLSGAVG